jgi:hypothetical protein
MDAQQKQAGCGGRPKDDVMNAMAADYRPVERVRILKIVYTVNGHGPRRR